MSFEEEDATIIDEDDDCVLMDCINFLVLFFKSLNTYLIVFIATKKMSLEEIIEFMENNGYKVKLLRSHIKIYYYIISLFTYVFMYIYKRLFKF